MNGLNITAPSSGGAVFLGERFMVFQEGYVYHIKDEYFTLVNDPTLMQNKEGGTYRPTYYCLKDEKTALLWVVPMSTKIEKYQAILEKQMRRYGRCLTIVIGEFDERKAAFLLQNMFPITEAYLDHIHTKNGNPVPVRHSLQQDILTRMKQLLGLIAHGREPVFTDTQRLVRLMLTAKDALGEDRLEQGIPIPHAPLSENPEQSS
jgi:hypothetical protein